ncbi:DUF4129 domain-containing protein [Nesterenkonia sp. Act20]|uniref:DUF4129 domain-containing protein n=1 Tax=Nesterenkonia sp. Act20 TaxID=1483432 RepID=UPI001C44808D|nr:DUF4129 domain-containing protein [Nesterenkonia sp. Act20]
MQLERDEASRLLEEELSDPRYQRDATGPLRETADRFFAWLDQMQLNLGPVELPLGPILLLGLLLAAIILCIVLVRPRLQRGAETEELGLSPASVTAAALRGQAEAHAAVGRFDEACRERFRAIIRAAEERQDLAEQAGRTATEAGQALAQVHPEEAAPAARAAELFNYSRYGGRSLQRADYDTLLAFDQRLERPVGQRPGQLSGQPREEHYEEHGAEQAVSR